MADAKNPAPAVPLAASGSGWQLVWGVLLIVSGVLAILMPGIAALATALIFAWLLIFGGAFEIVHAVQTRTKDGFGWKLASGVLTLVLGIAILVVPVAGVASLALMVGAFLLAGGVTRTMLAFRLKPHSGWGLDIVRRAFVDRRRHIDCHRLAAELAGLHRAVDRIFVDRDRRLADRAP